MVGQSPKIQKWSTALPTCPGNTGATISIYTFNSFPVQISKSEKLHLLCQLPCPDSHPLSMSRTRKHWHGIGPVCYRYPIRRSDRGRKLQLPWSNSTRRDRQRLAHCKADVLWEAKADQWCQTGPHTNMGLDILKYWYLEYWYLIFDINMGLNILKYYQSRHWLLPMNKLHGGKDW